MSEPTHEEYPKEETPIAYVETCMANQRPPNWRRMTQLVKQKYGPTVAFFAAIGLLFTVAVRLTAPDIDSHLMIESVLELNDGGLWNLLPLVIAFQCAVLAIFQKDHWPTNRHWASLFRSPRLADGLVFLVMGWLGFLVGVLIYAVVADEYAPLNSDVVSAFVAKVTGASTESSLIEALICVVQRVIYPLAIITTMRALAIVGLSRTEYKRITPYFGLVGLGLFGLLVAGLWAQALPPVLITNPHFVVLFAALLIGGIGYAAAGKKDSARDEDASDLDLMLYGFLLVAGSLFVGKFAISFNVPLYEKVVAMFFWFGLCMFAWALARELAWLDRRYQKVRLVQVATLTLSIAFRFIAIVCGAAALYALLYCK